MIETPCLYLSWSIACFKELTNLVAKIETAGKLGILDCNVVIISALLQNILEMGTLFLFCISENIY